MAKKTVQNAPKAPKKRSKAKTASGVAKTPRKALKAAPDAVYRMPVEVSSWIERAQSIMNHQKGEIERLKAENTDLKAYKRWAEHRILRSDHE